MADPRHGSAVIGVIAFYYPGHAERWDNECGAGFLGNFWPMAADAIKLRAPVGRDERCFCNAEAAFQALKFWGKAEEFRFASGGQAFSIKKREHGKEDFTYGGFGSNWKGMMAVLEKKFSPGSNLARMLQETDNAYLLEHNVVGGRDNIWSNNSDGEGRNWLGLQLMVLRDRLNGRTAWTDWIGACGVSMEDGSEPRGGQSWQDSVRQATAATLTQLGLPPPHVVPDGLARYLPGDKASWVQSKWCSICWNDRRQWIPNYNNALGSACCTQHLAEAKRRGCILATA